MDIQTTPTRHEQEENERDVTRHSVSAQNLGVYIHPSNGAAYVAPDPLKLCVKSMNNSMYMKKGSDLHIAGHRVDIEGYVRFRADDDLVVIGDLLVLLGKFSGFSNAQKKLYTLMDRNDPITADLHSLTTDDKLLCGHRTVC